MILRLLLLLLLFLLLVPNALCAAESPPPIVPEGEIVEAIEPILASLRPSSVSSISWSPGGRWLASGSGDGTVRIWDAASGRELSRLVGHSDGVRSVSWSPDGRRLASGSDDGTTRIWDGVGKRSKPQIVFAAGNDGRWLSCTWDEKRCLRFDDSNLARYRQPDGTVTTVMAPHSPEPPRWQVLPKDQNSWERIDGSMILNYSALNQGGAAYGVHLEITQQEEDAGTAIAAVAAGPMVRIGPGELADLKADLIASTGFENPREGSASLLVELVHAHGRQPLGTVKMPVKVPRLTVDTAELVGDDKQTLAMVIRNDGVRTSASLLTSAILRGGPPEKRWSVPFTQQVEQEGLKKDDKVTVSFGLPELPAGESIDKTTEVELTLLSLGSPLHLWRLNAPVTTSGMISPLEATVAAILFTIPMLFYIVGVLRHPLVGGTTRHPASLLEVPPEALRGLSRRLQLAFRRPAILEGAGVPEQRFDRATGFTALPPVTQIGLLVERLELKLTGKPEILAQGILLFRAETPDRLPLRLPRVRLVVPPASLPREEILAALRADEVGRGDIAVIICTDPDQRSLLREPPIAPDELVVVPSGPELTTILLADQALDAFARTVAAQVSVTAVSLYQVGGGVGRQAAFFGRDRELAHILARNPASYFLVGGRQIGKSSCSRKSNGGRPGFPGWNASTAC
jgi:hypothetical protein